MINLDTPIEDLPKVGAAYQNKLKKLGVKTVENLLFYFPSRYEDFSDIIPIGKVKGGGTACIKGKILDIKNIRTFKKRMSVTTALIEDQTGTIEAIWFNQPYLTQSFKENDFICLAGKVSLGQKGLYLNNPVPEKIKDGFSKSSLSHTGRIVPVYPETKGLSSRWLRFVLKPLLATLAPSLSEILPASLLLSYQLLPVRKAIWQIHFPDSIKLAEVARARFAFEELFLLQLSVLKEKFRLLKEEAPACPVDFGLMKKFTDSLPFKLTDSQKRCSYQILKDLGGSVPMSRLLEGDVGSGKTVVAAMAVLSVAGSGHQAAFMAPTEILANQHFKSLGDLLKDFGLSLGLLTGKEAKIFKDKEIFEVKKESLLEDLKNGYLNIIIGTHSLIQKGIEFKRLALVVVDEQHRFGVEQRAALVKNKKIVPHLLSMTATPIPRTLALTIYGDLDFSLIKEMPKNRKAVKTIIVEPADRQKAYDFIKKEAKAGKGIFVICPKIEVHPLKSAEGGKEQFNRIKLWDDVKAVKEEYDKLSKVVFPDLKIAILHGKIKTKEKERVMADFRDGRTDILISTSVLEVGVDVPRATVMMIEGAERFGLAQLHQFRGRVGRSDRQSYCFLFSTWPDQLNRKRLKAIVALNNGFELAQKDLEIRGPGQLYGIQQWGLPDVAMEGLSDIFLVEKTRQAAKEILEKDQELKNHPLLKERIGKLNKKIHFE